MRKKEALTKWNRKFSTFLQKNKLLLLMAPDMVQQIVKDAQIIGATNGANDKDEYHKLFFKSTTFHWYISFNERTTHISIRGDSRPGKNDIELMNWNEKLKGLYGYNKTYFTLYDVDLIKDLFKQDNIYQALIDASQEIASNGINFEDTLEFSPTYSKRNKNSRKTVGLHLKTTPLGITTIKDFYKYCQAFHVQIISMKKVGGIINQTYHAVVSGEEANIKKMRRHTDYWFK